MTVDPASEFLSQPGLAACSQQVSAGPPIVTLQAAGVVGYLAKIAICTQSGHNTGLFLPNTHMKPDYSDLCYTWLSKDDTRLHNS